MLKEEVNKIYNDENLKSFLYDIEETTITGMYLTLKHQLTSWNILI